MKNKYFKKYGMGRKAGASMLAVMLLAASAMSLSGCGEPKEPPQTEQESKHSSEGDGHHVENPNAGAPGMENSRESAEPEPEIVSISLDELSAYVHCDKTGKIFEYSDIEESYWNDDPENGPYILVTTPFGEFRVDRIYLEDEEGNRTYIDETRSLAFNIIKAIVKYSPEGDDYLPFVTVIDEVVLTKEEFLNHFEKVEVTVENFWDYFEWHNTTIELDLDFRELEEFIAPYTFDYVDFKEGLCPSSFFAWTFYIEVHEVYDSKQEHYDDADNLRTSYEGETEYTVEFSAGNNSYLGNYERRSRGDKYERYMPISRQIETTQFLGSTGPQNTYYITYHNVHKVFDIVKTKGSFVLYHELSDDEWNYTPGGERYIAVLGDDGVLYRYCDYGYFWLNSSGNVIKQTMDEAIAEAKERLEYTHSYLGEPECEVPYYQRWNLYDLYDSTYFADEE